MEIRFKRTYIDGLLNYSFVSQPDDLPQMEIIDEKFHHYLSLANRLVSDLSCFVLTRYSPFLKEVLPEVQLTDWHYNVLSDDFQGLGTDLGFGLFHRIENGNSVKEQSAYFFLRDILTLRSFPEDTFGDKSSHVTIFALKPETAARIRLFLSTKQIPFLPDLLLENELFIHITCSKSPGYYDTVLIKSVQSLTTDIVVNDL